MKLRRKILLFVTPLILLPLIVAWVSFYVSMKNSLLENRSMEENIQELASQSKAAREEAHSKHEAATKAAYTFGLANIGANIDGQLDAIEKSLIISTSNSDLQEALKKPSNSSALTPAREYLEKLNATHNLSKSVLFLPNGILLLESGPGIDQAYSPSANAKKEERETSLDTNWRMLPATADREAIVTVTSPLQEYGKENAIGYLQLNLPISQLATQIRGPAELTSAIRLTGKDGQIHWRKTTLAAMPSSETFSISQTIHDGFLDAEVVIPNMSIASQLSPFDTLSDSIEANLAGMKSTNSLMEESIKKTELSTIVIDIGLLISAVTLSSLFLSKIASKIETLNAATVRIQEGDLETRCPKLGGADELDNLSVNIDGMRERLKSQIDRLDKDVSERTLDLARANQSLEREVKERRQAEKAAIDANGAKSDFLATMSHEIRTPLSGILGGIHLLQKSPLNEDQSSLVDIVQNSTDTLNSLVTDILDFSKIEAGKLEIENAPFDLSSCVHEVCQTLDFKAKQKGFTIKFNDNLEDSLFRIGDRNRVKQIIYNLVGNAVKFTHEGSIEVTLEQAEPQQLDRIQISVKDTGIGMSEEQVHRIFAPFTQADSSIDRQYGGTGLGLSISEKLALQMDGSITVSSALGQGSQFVLQLRLPLGEDCEPSVRPGITSESPSNRETPANRILLAEDNWSNRLILSRILESAGFTVTAVETGQDCLEAALSNPHDLIIMDCSMPVMDGCTATSKIREKEGALSEHSLILGLTANATHAQRVLCLEAGMDDVLFKPLSGSLLIESCTRLISEHSS